MLMYCRHKIHISPCRPVLSSLCTLQLGHLLLFSRGAEWSAVVGWNWMPSRKCLRIKPLWPPFFSPVQATYHFPLSPAAAIHHQRDLSLARHDQNSSRSSSPSSFFLVVPLPSSLLWDLFRWRDDKKKIHPQAPGMSAARQLDSLSRACWPSSDELEVAMNDLAA